MDATNGFTVMSKIARIYHFIKSATQSGQSKDDWILEYPNSEQGSYSTMGWVSSSDTEASQISLKFSSLEEAENFAKRKGLDYEILTSQAKSPIIKSSYAANYSSNNWKKNI